MTNAPANPRPFAYVAVKPAGGRKIGLRHAANERTLSDGLRQERLVLLRSWALPGGGGPQRELSVKDQVVLNDQLSQLLGRGVPLVEALDVTASTVSTKSRPRIERVRELVAAGTSFSEACSSEAVADIITVSVYRAAERTGELALAGAQLATNARRKLALAGKAVTVMVYPAIVLSISIVMASFVLMVPVPRVAEALERMNVDLPWYTVAVVAAGLWLKANLLYVLGGLALATVLAFGMRAQLGAGMRSLMRRLPMMKSVVLAQESARFFSVMAAMTRSGIPLADALGVANAAVGHLQLKRQLTTLHAKLIEGGILRHLIENVTALPLATRRLLIAAERAGDLETAFDSLASDMADEVDVRTSRLLSSLEPLLIVLMFLVIGSLIASIMIPLITLGSQGIE